MLNVSRSSPDKLEASLAAEVAENENPATTHVLMQHVRERLAKDGPSSAVTELNGFLSTAEKRKMAQ